MSEIEALLKRAGDSLAAARTLLREGFPDYAASRAYYAMFYVAEALLAHLGQSYSSHAAVIAALGREYAKTSRLHQKFHRWLIAPLGRLGRPPRQPASAKRFRRWDRSCTWRFSSSMMALAASRPLAGVTPSSS